MDGHPAGAAAGGRGSLRPHGAQLGAADFPARIWSWLAGPGPFGLKPHQLSGAWRLVMQNGGLLGFDVGVGKTLTGIAAIARLRQTDRARRVMVVVPNSIVWKWRKESSERCPTTAWG